MWALMKRMSLIFGTFLLALSFFSACTGVSETEQRVDFITNKIHISDSMAAIQLLQEMDTPAEFIRPPYVLPQEKDSLAMDSAKIKAEGSEENL